MEEEQETVVESAETTTEEVDNQTDYEQDDSTGEGEGETQAESSKQHKSETPEQKRARLTRQLERLNAKHPPKEGEKGSKESNQESSKEEVDDRYERLELKVEGITSKKEQDVILDYARWKGIEPSEALKTAAIKAELAELRAKTTTPSPSRRTGTGANNSFEYWSAQARKGNFPKDPEMMEKLKRARIFTR